jgi:hypothetical protein
MDLATFPFINPEIPGWPTDYDLSMLGWLSSKVPGDGHIVEIGSWCGRSSFSIVANCKHTVRVSLVDKFEYRYPYVSNNAGLHKNMEGDPRVVEEMLALADQHKSWRPCLERTIDFHERPNVEILEMESKDYVPPGPISMVFIDGQHDGGIPQQDLMKFITDDECLIVLDDWNDRWNDVVNASVLARMEGNRAVYCAPWGRFAIIAPKWGPMLEPFTTLMRITCNNRHIDGLRRRMKEV